MPLAKAMLALIIAAVLEAAGDAMIRGGLQGTGVVIRVLLLVAGGLTLALYGVVVNAPSWDFGRLIGVYVAVFFLAAQVINAVAFKVFPTTPVLIGGGLIVAGGLVLTFWRQGAA